MVSRQSVIGMNHQETTKGTILYVGGFELPDRNAAANRVISNGKIFSQLGYRVAYLGMAAEGDHFEGVRTAEWQPDVYEEAHPCGTTEWVTHLFSTQNVETVMKHYEDLRMIVVYNVPFVTLKRIKRLCKKASVRVVYDCTEWSADTEGSLPKRLFKKWDERYVRTKIGRVSDGLIVISRCMEQQYAPHTERLLRLPPLVDLNDPMWHQTTDQHEGQFEFCFAGGLDGNKESLDRIVEAFCRLEDARARLRSIGVTAEAFYRYYPQAPTASDDRIMFMGRLSHKDTIRYVLGCDCYIFVRMADRRNTAGFPTKFAESFSCGVPIITTDVSDVSAYVQQGNRGEILTSTEVDVIYQAMQRRLQKTDLVSEKALDHTFHYETYLTQTSQWLKDMLGCE